MFAVYKELAPIAKIMGLLRTESRAPSRPRFLSRWPLRPAAVRPSPAEPAGSGDQAGLNRAGVVPRPFGAGRSTLGASHRGGFAPNGFIGLGNDFELRAKREGRGNGRVYHVSFTASDGVESCTGTVQVGVPNSRGRNGEAVDDGALFDSTVD